MTIQTIKANNLLAGQFFFSRETMKFFKSRVLPTVYGSKYFITSEVFNGDKQYTVREAVDGGKKINTPSIVRWASLPLAKNEARLLAAKELRQ